MTAEAGFDADTALHGVDGGGVDGGGVDGGGVDGGGVDGGGVDGGTGGGVLRGVMTDRWWIGRGPNGGHVTAFMVRAMTMAVADAGRHARSISVHMVRPAKVGPIEIHTVVDRVGGSVTNVRAHMTQDGAVVATSLGAFGAPWRSVDWDELQMPDVRPPEECPELLAGAPGGKPPVSMHDNWEMRLAVGAKLGDRSDSALTGGWVRLYEQRPVDAVFAAALTDSWFPAPLVALEQFALCPTIDLTVHLARPLPVPGDSGHRFCLLVQHAPRCEGGYFFEDCDVWSEDGHLLARGRQQGILIPVDETPPHMAASRA